MDIVEAITAEADTFAADIVEAEDEDAAEMFSEEVLVIVGRSPPM